MLVNFKPSQQFPSTASVAPQSLASTTANTGGTYFQVPVGSKWMHLRLQVGAGAGTVAVTVNQATSSGGAGTKALTLSPTITGITGAGVYLYDYSLDAVADLTGFNFHQIVLTTTGTLIVGLDASYGPAPYEA